MKTGFIFFALALILSLNAYVWLRGAQALSGFPMYRSLFLASAIILFILFIATMIFGNYLPAGLARPISFVGFSYFIPLIYLFLSFLAVDLIRIVNHWIPFLPINVQSFRFGTFLLTLLFTTVAMIIGNYKFNHPEVVHLQLDSNKPKQGKEITIVAASDIHLGISIDKKMLKKYVNLINAQHPDIVLLAGDVTDRWIEPVIRQNMEEEIREIKAPLGVFAVEGNHEHYAEYPEATAQYLRKSGVTVLQDQSALVNDLFYVVGRADRSNPKRRRLSMLTDNLNKNKPVIVLDHQPFTLEESANQGVDLQLSGHTHNGQFFPGNLFVKNMYEQGHGYLKKAATHFYVSSGLGIWGPQYRIWTQSELVVIKMKI